MQEVYVQDKTYRKFDFVKHPLTKGVYESCVFDQCNFEGSNLAETQFIDCVFTQCNLSLANIDRAILRDVRFTDCKMLGLRFDLFNPFGLSFSADGCHLNHATFYKTSLKKMVFRNCTLQEADFTESDLSSAVFDNCDLARAVFDNTNLEKADFRTACHYSLDPEKNRLKKAQFSVAGVVGLLDKYGIIIEK